MPQDLMTSVCVVVDHPATTITHLSFSVAYSQLYAQVPTSDTYSED